MCQVEKTVMLMLMVTIGEHRRAQNLRQLSSGHLLRHESNDMRENENCRPTPLLFLASHSELVFPFPFCLFFNSVSHPFLSHVQNHFGTVFGSGRRKGKDTSNYCLLSLSFSPKRRLSISIIDSALYTTEQCGQCSTATKSTLN